MSIELELEKAKAKALSSQFKKSAAYHEKMSGICDKCMKAHEGAADHHDGMVGKADDPGKAHHKAIASFHKTMASQYEAEGKAHKAQAANNLEAANASTDDPKKVAEGEVANKTTETTLPVETTETVKTTESTGEKIMDKTTPVTTAAVQPAAPATVAAVVAAAPATTDDVKALSLDKALDTGLQNAVAKGLDRILASAEFSKIIDEKLGNMMLEKLGTPAPTEVKTFAIPRTGATNTREAIAGGATPRVNSEGVDPEFADLVSMG